jgi:hypothetical protein
LSTLVLSFSPILNISQDPNCQPLSFPSLLFSLFLKTQIVNPHPFLLSYSLYFSRPKLSTLIIFFYLFDPILIYPRPKLSTLMISFSLILSISQDPICQPSSFPSLLFSPILIYPKPKLSTLILSFSYILSYIQYPNYQPSSFPSLPFSPILIYPKPKLSNFSLILSNSQDPICQPLSFPSLQFSPFLIYLKPNLSTLIPSSSPIHPIFTIYISLCMKNIFYPIIFHPIYFPNAFTNSLYAASASLKWSIHILFISAGVILVIPL